jgi:hypothetical protein
VPFENNFIENSKVRITGRKIGDKKIRDLLSIEFPETSVCIGTGIGNGHSRNC